MSIHPSLRTAGKDKRHRSVLKRYERLKILKEKGLWSEEKSALGIPKVKMLRIRVKKEKAAAEGAAPAAGTAAPAAAAGGQAAQAAKPAAGAKSEKK